MGIIVIAAVLVGFTLGWLYRSRLTSPRVGDEGGVPSPIADRHDDDVHLVASDFVRSTSSMRARMPSDPAIVPRVARGSVPPPTRAASQNAEGSGATPSHSQSAGNRMAQSSLR